MNLNHFGQTHMCNQCALPYKLGTAHSCLISIQEQIKVQQQTHKDDLKKIQREVIDAFECRDALIKELQLKVL